MTLDRGVKAVHSIKLYAYTLFFEDRESHPVQTSAGYAPLRREITTFTGDGVTLGFPLLEFSFQHDEPGLHVTVEGVLQVPGLDYELSSDGLSTNVVFQPLSLPEDGARIVIRYYDIENHRSSAASATSSTST